MKQGGIIIPKSAVDKQTVTFKPGDNLVILAKGDSRHDGVQVAKKLNCECWGLNDIERFPEITMLFELHPWDERVKKYNPVHEETSIPVFMKEKYADVPMAVKFPMSQLMEEFGIPYYNNQVCQIIAFAIHTKRFKNIYVFGVDYKSTDRVEQEFERPCTEFWLGMAMGRGINLWVAKESNMFTYCGYLKGVVYCYSENYEQPFDGFRKAQPHYWGEYILGEYGGRAMSKDVYDHDEWMSELSKFTTQYVHKKLLQMKELEEARDGEEAKESEASAQCGQAEEA